MFSLLSRSQILYYPEKPVGTLDQSQLENNKSG